MLYDLKYILKHQRKSNCICYIIQMLMMYSKNQKVINSHIFYSHIYKGTATLQKLKYFSRLCWALRKNTKLAVCLGAQPLPLPPAASSLVSPLVLFYQPGASPLRPWCFHHDLSVPFRSLLTASHHFICFVTLTNVRNDFMYLLSCLLSLSLQKNICSGTTSVYLHCNLRHYKNI